MSVWLTVIGMHPDGRLAEPDRARAALDAADAVFGAERHLEAAGVPAERRRPWPTPFSDGLAALHARRGTPTVVLATGDPMHFGIGATLASHVPADEMAVLPAPSAFSLAAARLGWPLDGVACVSLHGRSVDALARALQPGTRILALTSDAGTIATAVSLLRSQGFGDSDIIVLEAMGTERERRTDIEPTDIVGGGFDDLNTLAIRVRASEGARAHPAVPGLDDDAFAHDGQLTKREVRAVTVAALAPSPGALLWDLGAGSGSVAIEWMRAAPHARAIAFEKSPERLAMIEANRRALGVPDLEIAAGDMPDSLDGQPAPDAVFLGGAVSDTELFDTVWARLSPGGRLVANAVTLEGDAALIDRQGRHGGELVRIDVAEQDAVGRFRALRPRMSVLQWRVVKS
ncbi:precorrin-6y C5,15-methyltransferase (decarboxylating) subunit CbiE [Amorphus sp. MBR-141]